MAGKSPTSPFCFARCSALFFFLFVSFFAFALGVSGESTKSIHPTGYVTDLAGVIHADTKARLESLCTELQQKTGAQMAIVTVQSLEGRSIEEYAVDLYKQLGVGGKQDNRGVLLLLSPDEHKYRIEVGYGLEPVINDARAGDAGRSMVPFLRRADYDSAVFTAAWQLAKYIADDRGVSLSSAAPVHQARRGNPEDSPHIPLWLPLFVFFLIISLINAAARKVSGRGRRSGGGWWIGPVIGGLGGGGFGGSSSGWGGGGGFGGFGGGSSGGGGASGSW